MSEEKERVAMSFKFESDIPDLLEALAKREGRSMTNYLETLIRAQAIAAKLLKANGKPNSK